MQKKKRYLLHEQKDDMGTKEPLHPSTIIMKKEEVNETIEISRNGSSQK